MKYIVSACLLGVNCKYNGGHNLHQALKAYLSDAEVLLVCPEMLGGLPSPRPCCELRNGRVLTKEGTDVTDAFHTGADRALVQACQFQGDIAILQPRSPSCGTSTIYSGNFDGKMIPGSGIFAQKLEQAGIPVYDADEFIQFMEDDKKKRNPN